MNRVLLLAATLAAPLLLSAQGTVRGVLHDSLVTAKPIAGATLTLLGTGTSVSTDRRGRFSFEGLSPGAHRIAYAAPWLDSLGLPPLTATIVVDASSRVGDLHLATPSLATLARTHCRGEIERGYGVVMGEVRLLDGRSAEGAVVFADWGETRLGVGINERVSRFTVDTVGASGRYALCGVPIDAEFRVRADRVDGARTGDLLFTSKAPVAARDLVIADSTARVTIVGTALRPDGQPLAAAEVLLVGDSVALGRTDARGRFTVTGPWSSAQLIVRSLGLTPAVIDFTPVEQRTELAPVRLERAPQMLATVTSTGRMMTSEELEFEHRRRLGMGKFIDEETLSRLPRITPAAVMSLAYSLHLSGNRLLMRRGIGLCSPKLFVDGYPAISEQLELDLDRAKRIEVYRAAFAPPKFTDFNGCGAIIIWTR